MASHKSTLHTLCFRLVAIGSETIPTDRVMNENTDYTGGVVCTMSVVRGKWWAAARPRSVGI